MANNRITQFEPLVLTGNNMHFPCLQRIQPWFCTKKVSKVSNQIYSRDMRIYDYPHNFVGTWYELSSAARYKLFKQNVRLFLTF